VDSVEGEIFVIDGVEGPAQHSGLHLVLLLWQQLQLHVRVAAWIAVIGYTVKKVREFPVPSENNDVITELFLPRGSFVSDIPPGDGKLVNLFLRCKYVASWLHCSQDKRFFS
jgi:hypothetical protein